MKIKKDLFYILLSLAALITWGSGTYYGKYITEHYQSVSIRLKKAIISEEELIVALRNEEIKKSGNIPYISAWNCLEEQTITNEELSLSYKVHFVEVYGDIKQVYPMELTVGNLLTPNDYEGCIIDNEVAYQLFGTVNPVGNRISYGNEHFYIRGIIKSPKPVFFRQIHDKEHTYSNIELVYSDDADGNKLANAFMEQNNLVDSYTILDGSFFGRIFNSLYQVPAWFLCIYVLYQILRAIWKRRTIPLQVLILSLGFLSVWMVLKWVLDFRISIPEHLIPTKWSDFSFWTEKYKELRNQIDQIAYQTPVIKDILFVRYAKRCTLYILISLTCMWIFVSNILLPKAHRNVVA